MGGRKVMLKKLLQGLVFSGLHIKERLIFILHRLYEYSSDLWFMFSTPILSNGERLVAYLLAAFSITYLIVGGGYLITMMRTFGSQVQVEASVDIGEMLEAMALVLLTIVVLLVQSLSCMS